MIRAKLHRKRKIGSVPGAIQYTGDQSVERVETHFLQYDKKSLHDVVLDSHEGIHLVPEKSNKVDWYDVRGMQDTALIELMGKTFSIHPLALESAVDIHQRPKFEEYTQGNFLILKALSFDAQTKKIHKEHIGMYFTSSFLITFQETSSDVFESVRRRINTAKGRIRERKADYLAYALVDVVVDNYFLVMDQVEEVIEALEDNITSTQEMTNKSEIHALKKELLVIRKSIAPLREAIGRFYKSDSSVIAAENSVFLRDLYEHTIQIMDSVESYRDMLNGLQDLLMTEVSFKMNKVMQLLTLISVIFIPLTFLAGIYGMNFEYIPELQYRYGYFVLLGVMFVLFIILLYLFKRKRWL